MIQSIQIKNFKALNGLNVTFSPLTVLIGNNSAGKTSVLQAITFLKYCCISTFDKFLDEHNLSVKDIFSKFVGPNTSKLVFSTMLRLEGKDIQWDITIIRSKGKLSLGEEEVRDKDCTVLYYSNDERVNSYRYDAKKIATEPIMPGRYSNSIIQFTDTDKHASSYPELTAIKNFFEHMETLDMLSPQDMRKGSRGESASLGISGEKIGAFIKTLPSLSQQLLVEDIQKFHPHFSAVSPKVKEKDLVVLEAKERYDGKLIHVPTANISDGLLRIIALCSLRYLDNSGGAILLDEIEDGINNEHLPLLVQILQQIQKQNNVQIIATTHNTLLLDYWVDKREVDLDSAPSPATTQKSILLLYRNSSGTAIAKNIFDSSEIREKLSYMYPGEIIQNMTNRQLQDTLED